MNDVSFEGPQDGVLPIVDYSGISLGQLARLDDSTLVHSLNRILGDIDNPDEIVLAGFNASILGKC
jgi:FXSXX-COOH protein